MENKKTQLSTDRNGFIVRTNPRTNHRMLRWLIVFAIVLLAALFLHLQSSWSPAPVEKGAAVQSDSCTQAPAARLPGKHERMTAVSSAVDLEAVEIIVKETVPFPENCPPRIIQAYVSLFAQRSASVPERKVGEQLNPNSLPMLKYSFPRQAYFIIDGWKLDGHEIESQDAFRRHWPTNDFARYYALTYLVPILEAYPDWQRLNGYNYYRQRVKTNPVGLAAYYADPSAFREKP